MWCTAQAGGAAELHVGEVFRSLTEVALTVLHLFDCSHFPGPLEEPSSDVWGWRVSLAKILVQQQNDGPRCPGEKILFAEELVSNRQTSLMSDQRLRRKRTSNGAAGLPAGEVERHILVVFAAIQEVGA